MRTKLLALGCVLDELGEVALREPLVDREPEMRELERDVRPQPFGVDAVEQLPVGGDDLAGLGLVAHALAEQRRVREQTLLVQPPQDRDGRVEAFAGDEARGAEPEAVPLHEPLQARAVRGREEQAAEGAHLQPGRDDPLDFGALRLRQAAQRRAHLGPTGMPRKPSAAFDAAWKGKRCSGRAARSPSPPPPESAGGRAGRPRPGSSRRAPRPHRRHRRRAPLEQRLGADEHVEPFEEVRLEPLPGTVRNLHPGEVGARSRSRSITTSGIA